MRAAPPPMHAAPPPCWTLVVSDDAAFRAEASAFLSATGYDHVLAASPFDAIRMLGADERIGIVLCDGDLRGMAGTDFARELCERYVAVRPLVIVMATSLVTADTMLEALRIGLNDVLRKPLSYADGVRCFREASAKWRLRWEHRQTLTNFRGVPAAGQGGAEDDAGAEGPALELLRLLHRVKRERNRLLESGLFGDPAWEMLVDLMIARIKGEKVAVSSACTSTHASQSTALRCIKRMEEAGMIRRWDDPGDKRRDYVEISDHAFAELMCFFRKLASDG